MPEILASFSRASGRSVNLPESKRTSDIFTTRPRAVSRVSRIKLNCWRRRARSSPRSRRACPSIRIYEPQYFAKVDVSQERTSQGREFHFGKSLGLPFVHLGSHSRAKGQSGSR